MVVATQVVVAGVAAEVVVVAAVVQPQRAWLQQSSVALSLAKPHVAQAAA
ncbi:MAG TPA: hypothetical protein VMX97_16310 [Hyphomicrobiaceae bacterium]|nr:hypothetical protein [Hyphomicrobiaceae bacterium]